MSNTLIPPICTTLIIGDSQRSTKYLRMLLKAMGLSRFTDIPPNKQAQTLLDQTLFNLVVLDCENNPSAMIAIMAVTRGKVDCINRQTTAILIAPTLNTQSLISARDAGIDEILTKPYSPLGLHQRIQAVLDKKRPFVRSGGFAGPDRRRRKKQAHAERRKIKV